MAWWGTAFVGPAYRELRSSPPNFSKYLLLLPCLHVTLTLRRVDIVWCSVCGAGDAPSFFLLCQGLKRCDHGSGEALPAWTSLAMPRFSGIAFGDVDSKVSIIHYHSSIHSGATLSRYRAAKALGLWDFCWQRASTIRLFKMAVPTINYSYTVCITEHLPDFALGMRIRDPRCRVGGEVGCKLK